MEKMTINLGTNVIIAFISVIIISIGIIFICHEYCKTRYAHEFLTILIAILFLSYVLSQGFSFLFLSCEFYHLSFFFLSGAAILIVIALNFISRDDIEPISLTLITVFVFVAIFFSFSPNTFYIGIYPNGELGVFINVFGRNLFSSCLMIVVLLAFYHSIKIYIRASKNMKKASMNLIIGIIILGAAPLITTILNISLIIPAHHLIIFAIGSIIILNTIVSHPKIAYVLPFKVLRLLIMDIKSGITLYTHEWGDPDTTMDVQIFSGIIKITGDILNKSLNSGEVREIKLDNAILMFKKCEVFPISCVLISTKSSRTLKNSFKRFGDHFFNEYTPFFSKIYDLKNFESTHNLIREHFQFIPEFN